MKSTTRAVVQKTVNGRHGPYAVATSDSIRGSITFSLHPPVWGERDIPEAGVSVLLSDIRQKRAGWRAMSGRLLRPSDE